MAWDKLAKPKTEGGLGVRPSRDNNTAVLGKLVWEMHQHSPKLWAPMLHGKYIKNSLFLGMPQKQGSSVWNSTMKARSALRKDIYTELGMVIPLD